MEPIRRIGPASTSPAAIARVRRVKRTGEEHPDEERREPRRAPAAPDPAGAVDGDGHLDARA